MKTIRVIVTPSGRQCTLGVYVAAWHHLLTVSPDTSIRGWGHFPEPASEILKDIQFGIHDRINRHIPGYGKGRKWSWQWQTETYRAARDLNTPRLAIHWLPSWLLPRFQHRIFSES